MDTKAKEILSQHYKKFISREFTELEVQAFLIHIREYIDKNYQIHEICDFVAHREKDRGVAVDYLKSLKDIIDSSTISIATHVLANGVYNIKKIKSELNDFFNIHGYENLEDKVIFEILQCIISFMQHIPISKKNKPITTLYAHISGSELSICGSFDCKNTFVVYNPLPAKCEYIIPLIRIKSTISVVHQGSLPRETAALFLRTKVFSLYRDINKNLLINLPKG